MATLLLHHSSFANHQTAHGHPERPYRYRVVIVLRYWDDCSEQEIADALDCRPGTVKSLASRALARLRKEVDG